MFGHPSGFRPKHGGGVGGGGGVSGPPAHGGRANDGRTAQVGRRGRAAIGVDRAEAAAARAYAELLAAGEGVSAWRVAQAAALSLQLDSWGALGCGYHDVPTLRRIQFVEGKVNAFIHCFVSVRRMTSVHDLNDEMCKSEGVEKFEDLGLGSLLRYPLVQSYFSIPRDATEICQITTDNLVSHLSTFIYKYKYKEIIPVEEFLDSLVKRYSVAGRECLGVRVQSFGLYIKFIKGARRAESAALKSLRENGLQKEQMESSSDAPPVHMDLYSTQSDDFSDSLQRLFSLDKKKDIHSSNNGFNYKSSKKKKRLEKQGQFVYEIFHVDPQKVNKLALTNEEIMRFVATWKEVCQKHSPAEVIGLMSHVYGLSEKQKKKVQRLFLSYPGVGLLNVAIQCIKDGLLDCLVEGTSVRESISNTIVEDACICESIGTTSTSINMVDGQPALSGQNTLSNECEAVDKFGSSADVDDVLREIATYFGLNYCVSDQKEVSLEKKFVLHDCERWLTQKISVKEFKDLGFGNFFEFLEKHISMLPKELHALLTDGTCRNPLEVSMLEQQLLAMLDQAARNIGDKCIFDKQCLTMLLKTQFPTVSFQIMANDSEKAFCDTTKSQSNCSTPCSLLFSGTLSGRCYGTNSLPNIEKVSECSAKSSDITPNTCCYIGSLGSVSAKDATEILLKAPFLSDLQSWSHWDHLFAPSLGPLVEWLVNEGYIDGLSCILTQDGRLIRINNSASFDELLEAFIQGSAAKVVLQLLSLFGLYGGLHQVPQSLLKCYVERAINIKLKNFLYPVEAKPTKESKETRKVSELFEDFSTESYSYSLVSRWIIDCLWLLPPEFRSFMAEIIVSIFRTFTKDVASLVLNECKQIEERIMLHDIGLTLGIDEWINDYREFNLGAAIDLFTSSRTTGGVSDLKKELHATSNVCGNLSHSDSEMLLNYDSNSKILDQHEKPLKQDTKMITFTEKLYGEIVDNLHSDISDDKRIQDASILIETIRREEFGIDPDAPIAASSFLKKQHARLGRAIHCLSRELYSQDSHFLLELVQNADDNAYPDNVVPTLIFILQSTGIIVLNNEIGFSDHNIRALCDVGSSTKKGSSAGYIGQKGIGFKSVFRVTDAPEIHSNSFHVKFDVSDGEIGFVLPTNILPCDIRYINSKLLCDPNQPDISSWGTCIVLPFKSKLKQGTGMASIISMFSELHPSLLLFLHRLQCIEFKNMLDDKLIVMKKETSSDGIVVISHGKEKMSWLVISKDLPASVIRPDVTITKIAIAFTLRTSSDGNYEPHLDQQPAFAFLPLRKYGLKFIIQGDFSLPSSREEIDQDSAWNQWLLSELPDLFVSAVKSFCELSCFKENPGKAISSFMSFVPLLGEVHGFFSHLPHMILTKLRMADCLVLEGANLEWVPPCKVLRGWDEEVRTFLAESLLQKYVGLGYLNKDIILSDSLAKALAVQDYGPKLLIHVLSCICEEKDGIKTLGLDWLSSWLNAFCKVLYVNSSTPVIYGSNETELDLLNNLRKVPFIPLSDGSYVSMSDGPIWLPCDATTLRLGDQNVLWHFPNLYANLKTVAPSIFSTSLNGCDEEETRTHNIISILRKIGVRQLSAHDVVRMHILPLISCEINVETNKRLMIEYISFVFNHFQSACVDCIMDKAGIISSLRQKRIILTNHGFKCPSEEPIHFSKEFGNSISVKKLIDDSTIVWNEIDAIYLKHTSAKLLSNGLAKWREFFKDIGVTDFVQVLEVQKNVADVFPTEFGSIMSHFSELFVKDWVSPELDSLLSELSSNRQLGKCKYLLRVLDDMWDDYFSSKANGHTLYQSQDGPKTFTSSFMKSICNARWVASSMDNELHYPGNLFYDCEPVRLILGPVAPYAVPRITNSKLLEHIGFKVQVKFEDVMKVLQHWKESTSFKASISQMSKLYGFVRDELSSSREKAAELRSGLYIFMPSVYTSNYTDVVPGFFLPPNEVYWHDPTGCLDLIREINLECGTDNGRKSSEHATVSSLYPDLRDFFINDCGVLEAPPADRYFPMLIQLSQITSPSRAAHKVFQILSKWADDLYSGPTKFENLPVLKESLLKQENTVLPTMQDKWVSLHPHFGLICWTDNTELMEQFLHVHDVYLLQFGELSDAEKETLSGVVAVLLRDIGVPNLSEVVSREAIFYGLVDNSEKVGMVDLVLPYAQRYIYKKHPEIYLHLKKFENEKIGQLQVIVVEKLFYKHTLKGNNCSSNKRSECSCLLQGNILYATDGVDSHSLFLELSRLFFHGIPEPHIANFLHTIAYMIELGSTKEQLEVYIMTSQQLPQLPVGETIWSLSCLSAFDENEVCAPAFTLPTTLLQENWKPTKKQSRVWPPTSWGAANSAPEHYGTLVHQQEVQEDAYHIDSADHVKEQTGSPPVTCSHDVPEGTDDGRESSSSLVEKGIVSIPESVLQQSASDLEADPVLGLIHALEYDEKDRLCMGPQDTHQSYSTGRAGEVTAYKYFTKKLGSEAVKWVNGESETGLPYDLIIEKDNDQEYVEVKATASSSKDWFSISTKEWNFAIEKGDLYSIAWVFLSGANPSILILKNPVKLCQQHALQLALVMPHGSEKPTNSLPL